MYFLGLTTYKLVSNDYLNPIFAVVEVIAQITVQVYQEWNFSFSRVRKEG